MKPIEFPEQNRVIAKNQPQYIPLPAYVSDSPRGEVVSCWKLTLWERLKILFTGKLWLCQLTFNDPLQPQRPSVNKWDQLNKDYFHYKVSMKTKISRWFRNWFSFWFAWNFDLSFELCGYFDSRPRINLGLIFFRLVIILPFYNKGWEDECDSPKWGIAIHGNTFWIYRGGEGNMNGGTKWWTWSIPFFTKEWIRTSILMKDGVTWEHETRGNRKRFYENDWKQQQASWTYDFIDGYDGATIPTVIYVEEREWRPKWLTWTSLFAKTRRSIDVHFLQEVGSEKGSWKGGTIGCSYELLPNETPLDCLKRMEKERKF